MPFSVNRSFRRGVFVARGIGESVEVQVIAASGRTLATASVDAMLYSDRMAEGWQRWLDRVDPLLHIVRG